MKAQPCWVPLQIRLEVWPHPSPAFTSVFLSAKILLHPLQKGVEEPPHRTDVADTRTSFCWGFLWGWGEGMESGSDSAASLPLETGEFFRQAPASSPWHPSLRRAPSLAPSRLPAGVYRRAPTASSYPVIKTATTSSVVNMAFKGAVNPTTCKHLLSSRVLRSAQYGSQFSPTPDTKDSVPDAGEDKPAQVSSPQLRDRGWDGSSTTSPSGGMAWKPRPPTPNVGGCTGRRAPPAPGSVQLNQALSDSCLDSLCSVLF